MKASFDRQQMADALAAVCTITGSRTPKPILHCVRMQVLSDVVWLMATDLELSLRHAVTNVEVFKPGDVVVRADMLSQIVRECPDATMNMELVKNQLRVTAEGSRFQIVTQAAEEFPPVPSFSEEPDFSMEPAVIQRMVDWTAFAAARESSRYALNGVLLDWAANKATMVATDGRRMSCATGPVAPAKQDNQAGQKAIVPVRALQLIVRLAASSTVPVSIKILPNQLLAKAGPASIGTALVEGHFPPYRDVIPTGPSRSVRVRTADFLAKFKQAALLTNEESRAVRLAFSRDSLELSSRAPEQGDASITLAIRYGDEPTEIGFNPTFFLDVLRAAPSEEITFTFREPGQPGIIEVGEDLLHVVMPVSLSPN